MGGAESLAACQDIEPAPNRDEFWHDKMQALPRNCRQEDAQSQEHLGKRRTKGMLFGAAQPRTSVKPARYSGISQGTQRLYHYSCPDYLVAMIVLVVTILARMLTMILLMPVIYHSMRCCIERFPFDLGSAERAKVHGTPPRHSRSIALTLTGSFGTGPYDLAVSRNMYNWPPNRSRIACRFMNIQLWAFFTQTPGAPRYNP